MTKTQLALLKRIEESPHKQTCVIWGYRTHRKNGSYGSREFNAMIALRDAGVIEIIKSLNHQECGRSCTDNWHETVISLAVPSQL
jgi:hypothetical protein